MSAVAGLLLMAYGAMTAYLVSAEFIHPFNLTKFAAYVTGLLAALLILVGLAHFKAPHKAFLASIPLLICLHIQMYFNSLFIFARPLWPQQFSLLTISCLILVLSYLGYRDQLERAPSQ